MFWTTPQKDARLDRICQTLTAFKSFNDLVYNTAPSYRPSVAVRDPEFGADFEFLADAYDAVMEYRGDARRAYRF